MAPITSTTEIARPAEEVFAYVTDPSTMPEWQEGCVRGHLDGPTTRVGSKCTTVRISGGVSVRRPPRSPNTTRRIDGPTGGSMVRSGQRSRSRSSRLRTDHDRA
jgi:hypothetical protein